MKQAPNEIHNFFLNLGFSEEETTIYLTLSQRGRLTTLELARATGISRTQVYRLLETMKKKGVINEIVDEHRLMSEAVEFTQLSRLLTEKKQQLAKMEQSLPDIKHYLSGIIGQNQPDTKVLFYRGVSGFKQMIWNTLRAKKEIVGYTYRLLEEFVGLPFMTEWRDAFIKKGLVLRDIYSQEYLENLKTTKLKISYPEDIFPSRYLSPKVLDINLQSDFYNDVTAYYNWHEGDIFGVEIYNQKVAYLNKQIFEILWKLGKKEDRKLIKKYNPRAKGMV